MRPLRKLDSALPRAMSHLHVIPLFAEKPAHSSVPLSDQAAAARSGGQERPKAGAGALLLTVASTAACSRSNGTAIMRRSASRAAVAALVFGIAINIAGPAVVHAEHARNMASVQSQADYAYADHIADASRRFNIPATWIRSVMRVESANNPRALSPKGAIGLMQIMPATWRELRIRYGLGADPYDSRDNILAGAAYLREMHNRFGSPGFLAAYNAGPERYARHLATGEALPGETQNYVAMLSPAIEGAQREHILVRFESAAPWKSALLFAVPLDRRFSGPRSASALLPARTSRDSTIADLSALVPQSNGLFVRHPGTERVR